MAPAPTCTWSTVPASGASTECSIFIDSITATSPPAATAVPDLDDADDRALERGADLDHHEVLLATGPLRASR